MIVVLPNYIMSVQNKDRHDSCISKLHNVCNEKTNMFMILVLPNYTMSVQYKDIHDSGIAKLHNVCAIQRHTR